MKRVAYWGPANIRCPCKKLSRTVSWRPGFVCNLLPYICWSSKCSIACRFTDQNFALFLPCVLHSPPISFSLILFPCFLNLALFLPTHCRCRGYCCIWSHSMTRTHSIGILSTSDRPVAETSTWQHTALTRETPVPPAGFEPEIPASERPQTHALDLAATGIGLLDILY
jgi:hypothetical protein